MIDLPPKLRSNTPMVVIELIILLLLPLPFLKLNILYVIFALIIIFASKYLRKDQWSDYGFKSINSKDLFIAIAIGILFGFLDNFIIEPLIEKVSGIKPDLSTYEGVKGSVKGLIGLLALGWIIGGLFEEFFFRGYLFHRIETIVSNQLLFRIVAIVLTSIVFAFAHNYQGIGGIISTFYFSIIMGLLYFCFGRNVWYLIIIHGFYDTVGIFRLFLGL